MCTYTIVHETYRWIVIVVSGVSLSDIRCIYLFDIHGDSMKYI